MNSEARRWLLRCVAVLAILAPSVGMALPAEAASGQVLCTSSAYACAGAGYDGHDSWGYWNYGSSNAYGPHNCTAYAAFRASKNGALNPGVLGDASMWAANAKAKGILVDSVPALGAIAQWNSGHVAYIEEVGDGYIVTTDDNYGFNTTTRQQRTPQSGWPDNFIHIKDVVNGGGWGGVGNATFYGSDVLYAGASLPRNSYLLSPDGGNVFIHQPDGNVVLYTGGQAVWNSQTSGRATTNLSMQTDGHLVLYNGSTPVWTSNTAGSGASRLVVQDDGNVVLYRSNNSWVWQTGTGGRTAPYYAFGDRLTTGVSLGRNQYLRSADRRYVLIHQTDGNVVLYAPGRRPIWNTQTGGRATTSLTMQSDGHLVLYNGSSPVWTSNTAGSGATRMVVQSDGNLVLYRDNNSWVWQTQTSGRL